MVGAGVRVARRGLERVDRLQRDERRPLQHPQVLIIEMIRWTGLAPWEFDLPSTASLLPFYS